MLIHRSVRPLSVQCVCTETGVFIDRPAFPLSVLYAQSRRVCSFTGLHASSFSVCAQRHTGVLIYTLIAHSLFTVCTEMGALIYTPTAQSVCTETGNINLLPPLPTLFNVCTEMGVLIYIPTAQCVCTEARDINVLPPLPTLFSVYTETRVLIKFTHHRPLDAQCVCA